MNQRGDCGGGPWFNRNRQQAQTPPDNLTPKQDRRGKMRHHLEPVLAPSTTRLHLQACLPQARERLPSCTKQSPLERGEDDVLREHVRVHTAGPRPQVKQSVGVQHARHTRRSTRRKIHTSSTPGKWGGGTLHSHRPNIAQPSTVHRETAALCSSRRPTRLQPFTST